MGSQRTCLDWAVDGFNVTGRPLVYTFMNDFAVSASKPSITAGSEKQLVSDVYANPGPGGADGVNMGGVT